MAQTWTQFFMEWLDWIVGAALDANTDYASVDCRGMASVNIQFEMDATGNPDGQLYIEWSADDTNWYAYDFTADKYGTVDPGSKFTVTEATGEVDVSALAADSIFSLFVKSPPPYLRGRWVSDSGGDAAGMGGKAFGRMRG